MLRCANKSSSKKNLDFRVQYLLAQIDKERINYHWKDIIEIFQKKVHLHPISIRVKIYYCLKLDCTCNIISFDTERITR